MFCAGFVAASDTLVQYQWVYIGVFAPVSESSYLQQAQVSSTSNAVAAGEPAPLLPFKFRVSVAGRRFAHILDLPLCGLAQVR